MLVFQIKTALRKLLLIGGEQLVDDVLVLVSINKGELGWVQKLGTRAGR